MAAAAAARAANVAAAAGPSRPLGVAGTAVWEVTALRGGEEDADRDTTEERAEGGSVIGLAGFGAARCLLDADGEGGDAAAIE